MNKKDTGNFAGQKRKKQRNAPEIVRKGRNRVRFGCWRGWERLETDKNLVRKPGVRTQMNTKTMQHMKKENRRKPSVFAGFVAGAEGLEPSARGFGVDGRNAAGSGGGPVVPVFSHKSETGWCWFGAVGKFCGRSSSQIATDTIRHFSRIFSISTADSSFFSARAAASFSKNSQLAERISFALR